MFNFLLISRNTPMVRRQHWPEPLFLPPMEAWPSFCSPKCSENLRQNLPVAAARANFVPRCRCRPRRSLKNGLSRGVLGPCLGAMCCHASAPEGVWGQSSGSSAASGCSSASNTVRYTGAAPHRLNLASLRLSKMSRTISFPMGF